MNMEFSTDIFVFISSEGKKCMLSFVRPKARRTYYAGLTVSSFSEKNCILEKIKRAYGFWKNLKINLYFG